MTKLPGQWKKHLMERLQVQKNQKPGSVARARFHLDVALFLTMAGLTAAFFIAWMNARFELAKVIIENSALKLKLSILEVNAALLRKALDEPLLPEYESWQRYYSEYPVQFYVEDDLGGALAGAEVSVVRSGERIVTEEGGLTPRVWIQVGDNISINKEGFQPKRFVLEPELVKRKVIGVKLRRISHVES